MKTSTPKQFIGRSFVEASGIKPYIQQLINLERIPALKVLAILRLILYESFLEDSTKKPKGRKKINDKFRFEVVKLANEKTFGRFHHTSLHVKDEAAFSSIMASIINMSLLYFVQIQKIDHKTKASFLEGYPDLINTFNLLNATPNEDPSHINQIIEMSEYLLAQLAKDSPKKKKSVAEKEKLSFREAPTDDQNLKSITQLVTQKKVPEKQQERILTWNETLKLLRVSTSTLRRWEQIGRASCRERV